MANNDHAQKRSAPSSDLPLARKARKGPDLGEFTLRPREDAQPEDDNNIALNEISVTVEQVAAEGRQRQDSITSEVSSSSTDTEALWAIILGDDMPHDTSQSKARPGLQQITQTENGEQGPHPLETAGLRSIPFGAAATNDRGPANQVQRSATNNMCSDEEAQEGTIDTENDTEIPEQGYGAVNGCRTNPGTPWPLRSRPGNNEQRGGERNRLQDAAHRSASQRAKSETIDVDSKLVPPWCQPAELTPSQV